jgi:hypothetical protein
VKGVPKGALPVPAGRPPVATIGAPESTTAQGAWLVLDAPGPSRGTLTMPGLHAGRPASTVDTVLAWDFDFNYLGHGGSTP